MVGPSGLTEVVNGYLDLPREMLVRDSAGTSVPEQEQTGKITAEALRFPIGGAVNTAVVVNKGHSAQRASEG